jgi:hypothetical protein
MGSILDFKIKGDRNDSNSNNNNNNNNSNINANQLFRIYIIDGSVNLSSKSYS